MCGIFGLISKSGDVDLKALTTDLFLQSESRGKEATGLAVYKNGQTIVAKHPSSASSFIKYPDFSKMMSFASEANAAGDSSAIIGHCRLVTNGLQYTPENNQPVSRGDVVAVHNGIVVNVDELWEENTEISRKSEVDSEVIAALVDSNAEKMSLSSAAIKSLEKIEGAASIGLISAKRRKMLLATNTGSLFYVTSSDKNLFMFVSEEIFLKNILKKRQYAARFKVEDIKQLKPGNGVLYDLKSGEEQGFEFQLSKKSVGERSRIQVVQSVQEAPERELVPSGLKRCTRCVLPSTIPFIRFDQQGVCNFCHDHQPITYKGKDALKAELDKIRRKDGKADMIVTFSGGRDSSYALHLLKTEYNMNPVAMTYDWGMVTDLARRNQARFCGQLGIEHLLISADIEKKRANIGMNVHAWLKKPDLGMIPLFMAGDKQFFYYFNKVRKQTGLDSVVFSVNPLEKTNFKVGFCGVDQGKSIQPYHNKFAMASYYAKQFLGNSAYLNSSLTDTFTAYLSAYFLQHDYLLFYDYIPWDEDEINDVLINQYGWEIAEDSPSTWRIGDGTAAFYNYIYLSVAGFTENDAFRSNQVREGYITRGQAIALLKKENIKREASIREYLGLIGVDYNHAMDSIAKIPKLY